MVRRNRRTPTEAASASASRPFVALRRVGSSLGSSLWNTSKATGKFGWDHKKGLGITAGLLTLTAGTYWAGSKFYNFARDALTSNEVVYDGSFDNQYGSNIHYVEENSKTRLDVENRGWRWEMYDTEGATFIDWSNNDNRINERMGSDELERLVIIAPKSVRKNNQNDRWEFTRDMISEETVEGQMAGKAFAQADIYNRVAKAFVRDELRNIYTEETKKAIEVLKDGLTVPFSP